MIARASRQAANLQPYECLVSVPGDREKKLCRAIAFVGIDINDPEARSFVFFLQLANGYCNVINEAKSSASLGHGMVHAASKVVNFAIEQRLLACSVRSTRFNECSLDKVAKWFGGQCWVISKITAVFVDEFIGGSDGFKRVLAQDACCVLWSMNTSEVSLTQFLCRCPTNEVTWTWKGTVSFEVLEYCIGSTSKQRNLDAVIAKILENWSFGAKTFIVNPKISYGFSVLCATCSNGSD